MFLFTNAQFSFFPSTFLVIVLLPLSLSFYLTDSNPILAFGSQVRETHLFTANHRRGVYLQISLDGRVSGSEAQSPFSLLLLKSVKPGHTVIQGQTSSLFLCVDREGHLRGQSLYSEDECTFRELLLADGYTRFLSSHYGFPVSLSSRRSTDLHSLAFTRFLPLRNTLRTVTESETPPNDLRSFDVDSDDLFGMGLNSVVSPQFSGEK